MFRKKKEKYLPKARKAYENACENLHFGEPNDKARYDLLDFMHAVLKILENEQENGT